MAKLTSTFFLNVYLLAMLADMTTTFIGLHLGFAELNLYYPYPAVMVGLAIGFGFRYAEKWVPMAKYVNLIFAFMIVSMAVRNNILMLVNI